MTEIDKKAEENIFLKTLHEVTQPFKDLFKASRAMWGLNISYLLEGVTYFGVLSLLAIYFNNFAYGNN